MRDQSTLRVKWRLSFCFTSNQGNEMHMECGVDYCVDYVQDKSNWSAKKGR